MSARPFFARPAVAAVFILLAVTLDHWIKHLVVANMQEHVAQPTFIPYVFLFFTWNEGVAFSFLSGMNGWAIVVMRFAIVAFILWWWRSSQVANSWVHLGFCMVIAGALGNIVDWFAYGRVVDYVLFDIGTWSFAVFNLADSLITVGAVVIGFCEIFLNRKQKLTDD